jgi:hypothetical protein
MKNQSKKSYNKLTLEEEYAFEHKARIKAEEYISELWKMHGELENEVKRLQSIINRGNHVEKEIAPLNSKIKLKNRLSKIWKAKKDTESNLSEIIRRTFK